MLVVRTVGAGAHRYYLNAVGPPGLAGRTLGEAPGQWVGLMAGDLGCAGEVDARGLGRILAGRRPVDGRPLVRPRSGRLAGLDLVFAAPKSLSMASGLASADVTTRLLDAHDRAVGAAVDYLERRACAVRRARGRREPGAGLAGAAFRHRTSRAGDPHLHTHLVLANLTAGPDGRWLALHTPLIFAELRVAGDLYAAALRHGTTSLGLRWRSVGEGRFELEDVPRSAVETFSRRRAEALARVGEDGREGRARTPAGAVRLTRPARDGRVDLAMLGTEWRERAAAIGFALPPSWREVGRAVASGPLSPVSAAVLTATTDTFTRSDVIRAWCATRPDGGRPATFEALADRTLRSPEAIALTTRRLSGPAPRDGPEGPRLRFTSAAAVVRADRVVAMAATGRGLMVMSAAGGLQRWDGPAEIGAAAAARRRTVVGVAPGPATARDFEAATGIPTGSAGQVIAELEGAGGRRRLSGGRPLVVLTGGERFGSAELSALADASRRAGATLVATGVPGGDGLFDRLVEAAPAPDLGARPEPTRTDVLATVSAPGGTLNLAGTLAGARRAAVAGWLACRQAGEAGVLIAPDPAEAAELDRLARAVWSAGPGMPPLGEGPLAIAAGEATPDGSRFILGARSPRRTSGHVVHRYAVADPSLVCGRVPDSALLPRAAVRQSASARVAERTQPGWLLDGLGVPPPGPFGRRRWHLAARAVLAYRERWGVGDPDHALGPKPSDPHQRSDRRRVDAELRRLAVDLAVDLGPLRNRARSVGIGW